MATKTTNELEVEVQCALCKRTYIVKVPKDGYRRWLNGELIQNAMPNVPVESRELLISHTCSECFDKLFAND